MPNFVRLLKRRKQDLPAGETVLSACAFAKPEALSQYVLGSSVDSAAGSLASVHPILGLGALLVGTIVTSGEPGDTELSDDHIVLSLPDFMIIGVTQHWLLFWEYRPGQMGSNLISELSMGIPRTAVSGTEIAKVRSSRGLRITSWVMRMGLSDGSLLEVTCPSAYMSAVRKFIVEVNA